jgi:diguanylate cyclase (GGDEF)-like protein
MERNGKIEDKRKADYDRPLAIVRLLAASLYSLLLLLAAPGLGVAGWKAWLFISLAVGYGILRLAFPFSSAGRNHPPALDFLDFAFLGAAVYLTGGSRSFLYPAFALPVYGGIICFGARAGLSGLLVTSGIIFAMLFVKGSSSPAVFHTAAGLGTLALAAYMIAVLVESERKLREQISSLLITDHLTGLYNSPYLRERIREEINSYQRRQRGFALVFLDLDNFKSINDEHGHIAGDEALKRVARALKEVTRSNEVLARYGGDEFVLLIPETGNDEGLGAARRLQGEISRRTFQIDSQQFRITLSAGVAVFPEDGQNLDELLSVADRRMYRDKHRGGKHKLFNNNRRFT